MKKKKIIVISIIVLAVSLITFLIIKPDVMKSIVGLVGQKKSSNSSEVYAYIYSEGASLDDINEHLFGVGSKKDIGKLTLVLRSTKNGDETKCKVENLNKKDEYYICDKMISDKKYLVDFYGNISKYDSEYTDNSSLWSLYSQLISEVIIEDDIYPVNTAYWFADMGNVGELDLSKMHTEMVTDMSHMFEYICSDQDVLTINLGDNFDTSNVTDMSYMFSNAGIDAKKINLNLGNKFDTSKVTNMEGMFDGFGFNVEKYNLNLGDKFDTSNVKNMKYMFRENGSYASKASLNLGDKFDTSKVTNMDSMFSNFGFSVNDFKLDLGKKFNTKKVKNMYSMFAGAGGQAEKFVLNLGKKFDTRRAANMESFLETGQVAKYVDINLGNKFEPNGVSLGDFGYFAEFTGDDDKFVLKVKGKIVGNADSLFSNIGGSAGEADISLDLDTSSTTSMENMFADAVAYADILNVNLGDKFDTSKVTTMNNIFSNFGHSAGKATINIGNKFYINNAEDNVSFENTSATRKKVNIKIIGKIYGYANSLFTMSNDDYCSKYKLVLDLDTSEIVSMESMFKDFGYSASNSGSPKSISVDFGDKFDTSKVTNMANMFSGFGRGVSDVNLELGDKFDTSNVTNMSYMFQGMANFSESLSLDLGKKFDTKNVVDMSYMFEGITSNNVSIDLGLKFNTSNVKNYENMFNFYGDQHIKIHTPNTEVRNFIIEQDEYLTDKNVVISS